MYLRNTQTLVEHNEQICRKKVRALRELIYCGYNEHVVCSCTCGKTILHVTTNCRKESVSEGTTDASHYYVTELHTLAIASHHCVTELHTLALASHAPAHQSDACA